MLEGFLEAPTQSEVLVPGIAANPRRRHPSPPDYRSGIPSIPARRELISVSDYSETEDRTEVWYGWPEERDDGTLKSH